MNNNQYPQNQSPQQYPPQYQPPQGPYDPGRGLGIGSLVCGIIGLVLTWVYGIGLVPSIVGLILGVISGNKSAEAGLPRGGMATAGFVLSIISLALSALVFIACIGLASCAVCGTNSLLY